MRERRVLLGLVLVGFGAVGVWALAAPASFYADFPFDRGWVATDGPYNEHLVRDVGALNLALAVLLAWAVRTPSRARVRLAAGATLVYGVPHLVYHVTHLGPFGTFDAVAQTASLALVVVVPAWVLWRAQVRR